MMVPLSEMKKVGIGLTLAGLFFILIGVLLLFDRGLLAMGNILFILGVFLLIGFSHTIAFFFQWRKIRGTGLFFTGFILVIIGWTKVGFIIESLGAVFLFGDFFPLVFSFLRELPYIGWFFRIPLVKEYSTRIDRLPL